MYKMYVDEKLISTHSLTRRLTPKANGGIVIGTFQLTASQGG